MTERERLQANVAIAIILHNSTVGELGIQQDRWQAAIKAERAEDEP